MKNLFTALALSLTMFTISAQETIPSTLVKTLDGKQVDILKQINHNGPTVISFWATWCKPCIKELNAFMDYATDLEDDVNLKVLAVSIDDTRNSSRVAPLVEGQGWEYTVLLDENQDLKRNLGIVNVPFTLVLNAKGEIVWKHSGYTPGAEEDLAHVVEEVAAGKKPTH